MFPKVSSPTASGPFIAPSVMVNRVQFKGVMVMVGVRVIVGLMVGV